MPYPISIVKNVIVDLDRNSLVDELTEALKRIGIEVEITENKVIMPECKEFSSKWTSLKDFNRGRIDLDSSNGKIKVQFQIFLIEHFVIFLASLALGLYGFLNSGLDSDLLKIASLLLPTNFVYCFIFPLMALNSFLQDFIKRASDT